MARPTQTPSNCKLPLLQHVVDREKLADELVRRMKPTFAAAGNRVRGCSIEQLYYKPGGECRILFGMQFQPPDTNHTVRQLFYGCIDSENGATDRLESIDQTNLVEPRLGRPVEHLADWDMVVWAFPNDPQLRGLPMLADKRRVLERLRATPDRYGLQDAPVAIEAERTKYVPGRRCGYRFHVTLGNGSTQSIYAKSYAQSVAERAYRNLSEVANSRPARDGELIVPRPYCLDEDTDVVWQEVLPGRSLAKVVGEVTELPAWTEECGRRLAVLHSLEIDLPVGPGLKEQLQELQLRNVQIREAFPQHAEPCEIVTRRLTRLARELEPAATRRRVPIHGSFKLSHIFRTSWGVAFIDLDGASLGDPGYDLGRFIAALSRAGIKGRVDRHRAEIAVRAFRRGYEQAAQTPVPRKRIDWFAANQVLCSEMYKLIKRMDVELMGKLVPLALRLSSSGR